MLKKNQRKMFNISSSEINANLTGNKFWPWNDIVFVVLVVLWIMISNLT